MGPERTGKVEMREEKRLAEAWLVERRLEGNG
jgi:hypothetical protein